MGRALAQRGASSLAANATSLAERMGASPEMIELVRAQIAPDAPDDVLALFFARCQQLGCDPIGRMLYVINRKRSVKNDETNRWEKVDNWQLQSSIDLFRSVAESHGEYAGQVGPYWCGDDAVWTDVWLRDKPPAAAKVGVLRHTFKEPLFAVATWKEYAQYNDRERTKLGGQWETMPALMLAKTAEALALRKAFPAKLTGLYTTDEMQQADGGAAAREIARRAGSDGALEEPQAQVALPPAHDEKPQEKRTLADLSRLFAELQAEGETRPKVAYLTQNESRWLKPGARGVQERARNHAVTFSDAEIAAICTAIEDDLVQRRTFVQEAEVVTPGADDTEHEPECTCPDDGDEYHKPGCPADDEPPAAYPAELPLDDAMIAAPATGEHGPSQGQLDDIHAELTRLFGRSETKKTAWLKANGGWDAPSEIEFADHAQVVLDHLKGLTRA